jgi:hypothetical protein
MAPTSFNRQDIAPITQSRAAMARMSFRDIDVPPLPTNLAAMEFARSPSTLTTSKRQQATRRPTRCRQPWWASSGCPSKKPRPRYFQASARYHRTTCKASTASSMSPLRAAAKPLARDEPRRIAANIAKLPELLRQRVVTGQQARARSRGRSARPEWHKRR